MRKVVFFVLFLMICLSSPAEEEEFKTKQPMKAAALSLILPGAGQFYNESYLKSTVVIALELSLIGLAVNHHLKSEDYYDQYRQTQNEVFYKKYVDYYEKKQSDLWWVGTVIFFSVIDAYVDAHLYDFEARKKKIRMKFEENLIGFEYRF